MAEQFDAIVIGAGQAGPALAVKLAASGRRTAIVERASFGGTCVNVGCMPTKTLVASARVAHVARDAARFGVDVGGDVRVDLRRVKARVDAIVAESSRGVETWLRGTRGLTVIEGHARFADARTVTVGERRLVAPLIFVNVGGRPATPPVPGLAATPHLDSSSILALDELPAHLVVLGGSYIGLEFAQVYRRFGSAVTVVEMAPRLIPREDPAVSEAVARMLSAEGIAIHTNARCARVRGRANDIVLDVECDGRGTEVAGTHLLVAAGRTPNTDDLGLERAGVTVDSRGFVSVDEGLATGVPGIYALGEVNGRGAFTHTAWDDHEIVAANLLDGQARRVSDRIPVYALFVDPPLARAGMSEAEAQASGRRVLAGRREMRRVGRARERGETTGFMQVLVDADSERILGATLFGIEADEAIHCLIDAMNADVPYTAVRRAVHIHPTVAELVPTLLAELEPLPATA